MKFLNDVLSGNNRRLWILMILFCFVTASPVAAGDLERPHEFGLRGGIDDGHFETDFTVGEIYLLKNLPWTIALTDTIELMPRLDVAAFYISTDADDGEMFAAGFDLVLKVHDHFEMEAGFRPTWMPDYTYGDANFGAEIQFTSHVGLSFVYEPVAFNYRFQHTSNGGIHDVNPGLNLHMAGIGYRF